VRCIACNFDLVRSTAERRCPECGRAFDPDDVGTFLGEGHARWARRSATAPGWPMFLLAVFVGFLVLRTDFSPGRSFADAVFAFLAMLGAGALYLVRLFVALAARMALPKRRPRVVPIALWRWLLPIGIVLAAHALVALRVPRLVAFVALDRAQLEAIARGPAIEPSRWTTVSAGSGVVERGAVWADLEVVAFDPASELGRTNDPFDFGFAWQLEGDDMKFIRKSGDPENPGVAASERMLRLRLARLAIFPIAGKGYGGFSEPAWVYAPDAPDLFILPHLEQEEIPYPLMWFRRFSGDWFVSLGGVARLEDRAGGAGASADPAPAPASPEG
jgi:hypothetical protein